MFKHHFREFLITLQIVCKIPMIDLKYPTWKTGNSRSIYPKCPIHSLRFFPQVPHGAALEHVPYNQWQAYDIVKRLTRKNMSLPFVCRELRTEVECGCPACTRAWLQHECEPAVQCSGGCPLQTIHESWKHQKNY